MSASELIVKLESKEKSLMHLMLELSGYIADLKQANEKIEFLKNQVDQLTSENVQLQVSADSVRTFFGILSTSKKRKRSHVQSKEGAVKASKVMHTDLNMDAEQREASIARALENLSEDGFN